MEYPTAIDATRIGSSLDSILRVFDANGVTLAIVNDEAEVNLCTPGGSEVTQQIAGIMA